MGNRLHHPTRRPFMRHAVAWAARHALLLTALGSTALLVAPGAAQAQAGARSYAIPAGPLEGVLTRFALESGLMVSYTSDDVAGKMSPGLNGSHEAATALKSLLAGTHLAAHPQPNGGYLLRAAALAPAIVNEKNAAVLPVVKVTATQDAETAASPVVGYVARRSATGTKTDTPLLELPQSISVIGRDEMNARGALDVMDAVRYTPGVTTSMYGPDNRGWEDILLRGFATTYATYRDGLAQPPFGITYYLTEPYALERVEVLRGPSSMVFGQGDAGGVINRVSKQPTGERIREVELQYGSHSRQQLALDIGDALGSGTDLSYRVVGVALDSDDQDRYPDGHRVNRTRSYLAPSLRWAPSAQTSLTVFGEYLDSRAGEDPYYYSVGRVLTDVKMGDYSFTHMNQTQAAIGYRFQTALAADWTLRQNFRHSHIALSRHAIWLDGLQADGHTLSRVARTWDDPMRMTALDTHVQGQLRHGTTEHTVLVGLDIGNLKGRERRFTGPAPDLDLEAPVYGQPVPTPTDPVSNLTQTTRQIGLYAQDQVKFDERWVATFGGRQDQVRQVTDDALNGTGSRNTDKAFSARAGVNYLAGNGWAPYASYAESFLPANGVDAQGEPFEPSRGKQVELGVKFQPPGSRSLFTAAVFDLRKTHVVSYDPVTGEGRQIGKQRSRGVELEAKSEVARGLNATVSYTWTDMKVLQSSDAGEVGKVPPLLPKQSASLWLDQTFGNGLGAGAGLRYVGPRWNDAPNSSQEPSFTVVDAAVHYDTGAWRLALNVSNLFDRDYNTICYNGECYRGNLRAATLSARYNF